MCFLKHHKYLNVTNTHSLCVSVKALWTDLGRLFLLCSYMPGTHLKSFDPRAAVSVEENFTSTQVHRWLWM